MTEEAQNVAIAEACGWKWERCSGSDMLIRVDPPGGTLDNRKIVMFVEDAIPKFTRDLNAMHEAEKWLRASNGDGIWGMYADRLASLSGGWALHSTAPQRAEAFLKTIGKWKETHGN